MKLFGVLVVPEGWRWPRLVSHLFDHESTTVTLGLWTFIIASVQSIRAPQQYTAEIWLWSLGLCSILVGGVRLGNQMIEALSIKMNGGKLPPEAPKKEAKPDAPLA